MQTTGHIIINREKIKVLVRLCSKREALLLKIRETGKDGTFFQDESDFLSDNPAVLDELKNGRTISL
jgi:hypothetical protein